MVTLNEPSINPLSIEELEIGLFDATSDELITMNYLAASGRGIPPSEKP